MTHSDRDAHRKSWWAQAPCHPTPRAAPTVMLESSVVWNKYGYDCEYDCDCKYEYEYDCEYKYEYDCEYDCECKYEYDCEYKYEGL